MAVAVYPGIDDELGLIPGYIMHEIREFIVLVLDRVRGQDNKVSIGQDNCCVPPSYDFDKYYPAADRTVPQVWYPFRQTVK